MKLFRIEYTVARDEADQSLTHYEGTKAEAHLYVKSTVPKTSWLETTITETEMQTDKAGIVAALRGEPVQEDVRTWGITSRGGLKEE